MSTAEAPRGRFRVRFIGGPWDGKEVRLAGTNEGPGLPQRLYVRTFPARGERPASQSLTTGPCSCPQCQAISGGKADHDDCYVMKEANSRGFVFQLEGLNL